MSNKWLTYFTGEEDRDEEEEKKKKEAAEAKKPTTWEEYFRQQSPEPEEEALPAVQPKKKEEASEQGAPSIIDRLAARGITVELPEPKKESSKEEDSWGAIQPSLTGEGSAMKDSAAKSTFTSRLQNTATAENERTNKLAAQLEEARKDETVRNQEWLDSLRSEEEIQADLDAAKKDTVAANREDVKEGLLGDLKWLFSNGDRQKREKEDFNKNKRANAEKIQALEDELAERKWADYEQLRESGDFAQKSGYDKTNKVGETEINPAGGVRKSGYKDAKYAYINGDEDAGTELFINKTDTNNSAGMFGMFVPNSATEYQQYDEMTDDERSLYNYIHNTQGQEAADEYLDYLTSDLYARQAQREKNEARTYAMEHPVKASAATLAATPFRGMAFAGQTADLLANGKIDPNEPYNRIAYLPAAAREQVASDIERNWGEWGSFGYQTGMSMLDFLINSKLSLGNEAFSLALMGTSAAADATMAAKERGLSDAQSWVLGAMAGAAEIISEKVSFEMLFNEVERKTHPIRYILQNALFEGLEEGESDVINWVADAIVSQDKSEWQEDIRAYQKDNPGTSENDAFWAVLLSRLKEGGLDMLGGSISGGLMAGMGVTEEKVLGNAQRNADRSAEIEATRRATQAVRDLTQGTAGTDITKGIQNAQQQAQTEQQIVLPTPDQNSGLPTGEETQAQENPVRAQEAQEQNTAAEPEGIVLSTGAEDAEAEMAAESKGGDTLRFGTELETRTLTPTVEEAELNDAVDKAEAEGSITRATGIRYGVKEKTIRLMERLSEVTGHRVQFFDGKLANGQTANGFTNKTTGDIYINANAEQPVLFTFAHEFTHNLEGTEAYQALMDHFKSRAMEQGFDWQQERDNKKPVYERGLGQQVDNTYIDQEILADRIAENLGDEKTIREICRENPSAAKRIRDALDKFVIRTSNLGGVMSGYEQEKMQNAVKAFDRWLQREEQREAAAQEAREAAQTGETAQAAVYPSAAETMQTSGAAEGTEGGESPAEYLARMGELYDAGEISEEDYEAAQDLAAEMESTGRGIETSTVERDEGPRGKIAEAFDRITRGGQVRASLSPEETERLKKDVGENRPLAVGDEVRASLSLDEEYQDKAEEKNRQSKKVKARVLEQAGKARTEIKQKLESVKETANLPPDIPGNTAQGNSAYGTSEENTTVCPRSLAIDSLSDAVADQLGRPLTVEESLYIAQEAFNYTDMPQCLYCYVAMDRMAKREYMGEYLNKRNSVIENLQSGMSVEAARDVYKQAETNNGKDEKNWTGARQARFNQWVKEFQTGARTIQMSDLASDAAVERAMKDPQLAPQIRDAMKYAQSASWAKKRVGYAAYNGHILKWSQDRINKLNSMFGLRMYSFSDYSPAFVLENMQMVTDAAVRGLKMLAYTKDLDFVKIFAGTDMNINISTFGMDGSDGTVHQDGMQGADWAEAQALREEHPNVGITFVATNDNQVEWALDRDWIDVVIPFHMVKTGATVANIMGYRNYTGESSDRTAEGKKGEIYPNEHQNDREKYFAALEKQGLEPRFKRWADNPNYMKLVNETRRSAQDTPAVQPIFDANAVEAAKQSIDGMVRRGGYDVPIGGSLDVQAELAEEMADKISSGMAENLKIRNGIIMKDGQEIRMSLSEEETEQRDEEYRAAVDAGDMETAQQMVDEAAEANGYDTGYLVYRGDSGPYNILKTGAELDEEYNGEYSDDHGNLGNGLYFTPNLAYAQRFVGPDGTLRKFYLKSDMADLENADTRAIRAALLDEMRDETGGFSRDELYEALMEETGTNGIRARGVGGLSYGAEEALVRESWQAKLADPVTYDDDGNVIPLSERFNDQDDDIRYSLAEEQDQNDLAGMSQKAKAAALRIERQLTGDILQGIQRNVNPNSAEFRQFRADVARPVVEQLLRGEQADVDAVLESTGIDIVGQAAARGAVNDALRRANGELARIRTAVQESNARQQAREARNAELDAQIPDTSAGLIDLANRVKDAKKRLNTLKARTIMSEEDMEIAHQIATGQMTEEEARARYQYGIEDIVAMAEAEREAAEANAPWERYVKRLAERRHEKAEKDLTNAQTAKDKSIGFAYERETPERNFRDVFGKDAPALIDDFIRPVHRSEAESTRFKNEYNKRVKDLGLDRKVRRGNAVSEAAAVQFLGEAEDNVRVLELARTQNAVRDGKTLNEWRAEIEAFKTANPNLDYGKINRGIAEFQKIYAELIEQMNNVLVENGYLPVNIRRGYFPHFQSGTDTVLSTFANLLGIRIENNALPTSINGLTSMFKPGKPWFSHAMERTGFATDYDAVQGFDGYLGGVSDVIHQTSNIRNLRALGSQIRTMFSDEGLKEQIQRIETDDNLTEEMKLAAISDVYRKGKYQLSSFVSWLDEYTNLLANKKSRGDRWVEDKIGRKWYTRFKNLEGRVAANMIAGNLGSALTNFIPLNQAGAMLGDAAMLRGAWDTMTGRARDDGFVNRSDFLTNRRGVDPLIRGGADKISEFLSAPMNIIDNFTSEAIVRAAYGKYLRQGMDEQTAMQAADEFAAGVMADRSKGALPTVFSEHNPISKLFTQFQVEVNNEFSTIFKDIPKGVHLPEKDRKNLVAVAAWTLLRYFIGAYLFNDLYEKIVGRRAALDPLDIANDAIGDLTGYKLNNTFDMLTEGVIEQQKKANPSDALMELGKNTAEELPFIGGLLGGGRIPINSALPDTETIVKGLTNENWSGEKKAQVVGRELGKTVGTYILPPFAGGAGKKAFQTVENTLAGGRYVKDAEGNDQLQYPYFTDTPLDTAKTVAQSLLFGPTATEGGKAWVEGGFGNQSVKNTNLYKELTQEFGESQRESWNIINNIKPKDKYGNKMLVAESGLSEEGKAAAMEAVVNDGKSTEPQKFRAAYNNGVSADAWAALYGAMEEYDLNGNKQYTQAEIKEALDNITVPLSSGEGAAQGLFGGSTETRHLTNAEKAALWSAYDPTWATKNNPYDPVIGARVVAEYNRLKNEKVEESEDEE